MKLAHPHLGGLTLPLAQQHVGCGKNVSYAVPAKGTHLSEEILEQKQQVVLVM